MKKLEKSVIRLLFSLPFFCFLISCGIPNFSPVGILSTSISSESAVISGSGISDYINSFRSDEPKICFFYTIAPSGASYLSSISSAFNSSYVSNTNLKYIVFQPNGSNKPFITAKYSNEEVGLYQFIISNSSSDSVNRHKEAFISGLSDFSAVTENSLTSEFSFELDSSTKDLIFRFTDGSGQQREILLKRFNGTSFSTDSEYGGSSYSGNEVPEALESLTENYSLYVFASSEAAFNSDSFNNVLHSSLARILEFQL